MLIVFYFCYEFLVVADVVVFIVVFAGENHNDAVGAEVGELSPDVAFDIKAFIG